MNIIPRSFLVWRRAGERASRNLSCRRERGRKALMLAMDVVLL